ncbi:MAG: acyl-CoA dehydrogenase family protein [Pseudomonadota bacterium]
MTETWREAWSALAGDGLLNMALPKEYGGQDRPLLECLERLQSWGETTQDLGRALGLGAQLWPMQMPILEFGSQAQKQALLPGLADGHLTCCHAITEANSGSNALALSTRAEPCEAGYRINGEKVLIGMAPVADFAFLFATLDPAKGPWGVTAFLVDLTSPGIARGPNQRKMGSNTLPFGSLTFEDVEVPASALLGREGGGAAIFTRSLDWERRFIFAPFVGAMKRQLRDAIAFAKSRKIDPDHAIEAHQSVSNRLADMRLRYETAQLMLGKAAQEVVSDTRNEATAALTKLHLSEAFLANSQDALRIQGGQGYLEGSPAEQDLREAHGAVLYGGTSDIQRNIIARSQSLKGL